MPNREELIRTLILNQKDPFGKQRSIGWLIFMFILAPFAVVSKSLGIIMFIIFSALLITLAAKCARFYQRAPILRYEKLSSKGIEGLKIGIHIEKRHSNSIRTDEVDRSIVKPEDSANFSLKTDTVSIETVTVKSNVKNSTENDPVSGITDEKTESEFSEANVNPVIWVLIGNLSWQNSSISINFPLLWSLIKRQHRNYIQTHDDHDSQSRGNRSSNAGVRYDSILNIDVKLDLEEIVVFHHVTPDLLPEIDHLLSLIQEEDAKQFIISMLKPEEMGTRPEDPPILLLDAKHATCSVSLTSGVHTPHRNSDSQTARFQNQAEYSGEDSTEMPISLDTAVISTAIVPYFNSTDLNVSLCTRPVLQHHLDPFQYRHPLTFETTGEIPESCYWNSPLPNFSLNPHDHDIKNLTSLIHPYSNQRFETSTGLGGGNVYLLKGMIPKVSMHMERVPDGANSSEGDTKQHVGKSPLGGSISVEEHFGLLLAFVLEPKKFAGLRRKLYHYPQKSIFRGLLLVMKWLLSILSTKKSPTKRNMSLDRLQILPLQPGTPPSSLSMIELLPQVSKLTDPSSDMPLVRYRVHADALFAGLQAPSGGFVLGTHAVEIHMQWANLNVMASAQDAIDNPVDAKAVQLGFIPSLSEQKQSAALALKQGDVCLELVRLSVLFRFVGLTHAVVHSALPVDWLRSDPSPAAVPTLGVPEFRHFFSRQENGPIFGPSLRLVIPALSISIDEHSAARPVKDQSGIARCAQLNAEKKEIEKKKKENGSVGLGRMYEDVDTDALETTEESPRLTTPATPATPVTAREIVLDLEEPSGADHVPVWRRKYVIQLHFFDVQGFVDNPMDLFSQYALLRRGLATSTGGNRVSTSSDKRAGAHEKSKSLGHSRSLSHSHAKNSWSGRPVPQTRTRSLSGGTSKSSGKGRQRYRTSGNLVHKVDLQNYPRSTTPGQPRGPLPPGGAADGALSEFSDGEGAVKARSTRTACVSRISSLGSLSLTPQLGPYGSRRNAAPILGAIRAMPGFSDTPQAEKDLERQINALPEGVRLLEHLRVMTNSVSPHEYWADVRLPEDPYLPSFSAPDGPSHSERRKKGKTQEGRENKNSALHGSTEEQRSNSSFNAQQAELNRDCALWTGLNAHAYFLAIRSAVYSDVWHRLRFAEAMLSDNRAVVAQARAVLQAPADVPRHSRATRIMRKAHESSPVFSDGREDRVGIGENSSRSDSARGAGPAPAPAPVTGQAAGRRQFVDFASLPLDSDNEKRRSSSTSVNTGIGIHSTTEGVGVYEAAEREAQATIDQVESHDSVREWRKLFPPHTHFTTLLTRNLLSRADTSAGVQTGTIEYVSQIRPVNWGSAPPQPQRPQWWRSAFLLGEGPLLTLWTALRRDLDVFRGRQPTVSSATSSSEGTQSLLYTQARNRKGANTKVFTSVNATKLLAPARPPPSSEQKEPEHAEISTPEPQQSVEAEPGTYERSVPVQTLPSVNVRLHGARVLWTADTKEEATTAWKGFTMALVEYRTLVRGLKTAWSVSRTDFVDVAAEMSKAQREWTRCGLWFKADTSLPSETVIEASDVGMIAMTGKSRIRRKIFHYPPFNRNELFSFYAFQDAYHRDILRLWRLDAVAAAASAEKSGDETGRRLGPMRSHMEHRRLRSLNQADVGRFHDWLHAFRRHVDTQDARKVAEQVQAAMLGTETDTPYPPSIAIASSLSGSDSESFSRLSTCSHDEEEAYLQESLVTGLPPLCSTMLMPSIVARMRNRAYDDRYEVIRADGGTWGSSRSRSDSGSSTGSFSSDSSLSYSPALLSPSLSSSESPNSLLGADLEDEEEATQQDELANARNTTNDKKESMEVLQSEWMVVRSERFVVRRIPRYGLRHSLRLDPRELAEYSEPGRRWTNGGVVPIHSIASEKGKPENAEPVQLLPGTTIKFAAEQWLVEGVSFWTAIEQPPANYFQKQPLGNVPGTAAPGVGVSQPAVRSQGSVDDSSFMSDSSDSSDFEVASTRPTRLGNASKDKDKDKDKDKTKAREKEKEKEILDDSWSWNITPPTDSYINAFLHPPSHIMEADHLSSKEAAESSARPATVQFRRHVRGAEIPLVMLASASHFVLSIDAIVEVMTAIRSSQQSSIRRPVGSPVVSTATATGVDFTAANTNKSVSSGSRSTDQAEVNPKNRIQFADDSSSGGKSSTQPEETCYSAAPIASKAAAAKAIDAMRLSLPLVQPMSGHSSPVLPLCTRSQTFFSCDRVTVRATGARARAALTVVFQVLLSSHGLKPHPLAAASLSPTLGKDFEPSGQSYSISHKRTNTRAGATSPAVISHHTGGGIIYDGISSKSGTSISPTVHSATNISGTAVGNVGRNVVMRSPQASSIYDDLVDATPASSDQPGLSGSIGPTGTGSSREVASHRLFVRESDTLGDLRRGLCIRAIRLASGAAPGVFGAAVVPFSTIAVGSKKEPAFVTNLPQLVNYLANFKAKAMHSALKSSSARAHFGHISWTLLAPPPAEKYKQAYTSKMARTRASSTASAASTISSQLDQAKTADWTETRTEQVLGRLEVKAFSYFKEAAMGGTVTSRYSIGALRLLSPGAGPLAASSGTAPTGQHPAAGPGPVQPSVPAQTPQEPSSFPHSASQPPQHARSSSHSHIRMQKQGGDAARGLRQPGVGGFSSRILRQRSRASTETGDSVHSHPSKFTPSPLVAEAITEAEEDSSLPPQREYQPESAASRSADEVAIHNEAAALSNPLLNSSGVQRSVSSPQLTSQQASSQQRQEGAVRVSNGWIRSEDGKLRLVALSAPLVTDPAPPGLPQRRISIEDARNRPEIVSFPLPQSKSPRERRGSQPEPSTWNRLGSKSMRHLHEPYLLDDRLERMEERLPVPVVAGGSWNYSQETACSFIQLEIVQSPSFQVILLPEVYFASHFASLEASGVELPVVPGVKDLASELGLDRERLSELLLVRRGIALQRKPVLLAEVKNFDMIRMQVFPAFAANDYYGKQTNIPLTLPLGATFLARGTDNTPNELSTLTYLPRVPLLSDLLSRNWGSEFVSQGLLFSSGSSAGRRRYQHTSLSVSGSVELNRMRARTHSGFLPPDDLITPTNTITTTTTSTTTTTTTTSTSTSTSTSTNTKINPTPTTPANLMSSENESNISDAFIHEEQLGNSDSLEPFAGQRLLRSYRNGSSLSSTSSGGANTPSNPLLSASSTPAAANLSTTPAGSGVMRARVLQHWQDHCGDEGQGPRHHHHHHHHHHQEHMQPPAGQAVVSLPYEGRGVVDAVETAGSSSTEGSTPDHVVIALIHSDLSLFSAYVKLASGSTVRRRHKDKRMRRKEKEREKEREKEKENEKEKEDKKEGHIRSPYRHAPVADHKYTEALTTSKEALPSTATAAGGAGGPKTYVSVANAMENRKSEPHSGHVLGGLRRKARGALEKIRDKATSRFGHTSSSRAPEGPVALLLTRGSEPISSPRTKASTPGAVGTSSVSEGAASQSKPTTSTAQPTPQAYNFKERDGTISTSNEEQPVGGVALVANAAFASLSSGTDSARKPEKEEGKTIPRASRPPLPVHTTICTTTKPVATRNNINSTHRWNKGKTQGVQDGIFSDSEEEPLSEGVQRQLRKEIQKLQLEGGMPATETFVSMAELQRILSTAVPDLNLKDTNVSLYEYNSASLAESGVISMSMRGATNVSAAGILGKDAMTARQEEKKQLRAHIPAAHNAFSGAAMTDLEDRTTPRSTVSNSSRTSQASRSSGSSKARKLRNQRPDKPLTSIPKGLLYIERLIVSPVRLCVSLSGWGLRIACLHTTVKNLDPIGHDPAAAAALIRGFDPLSPVRLRVLRVPSAMSVPLVVVRVDSYDYIVRNSTVGSFTVIGGGTVSGGAFGAGTDAQFLQWWAAQAAQRQSDDAAAAVAVLAEKWIIGHLVSPQDLHKRFIRIARKHIVYSIPKILVSSAVGGTLGAARPVKAAYNATKRAIQNVSKRFTSGKGKQ